jgi:hypothetical protein
MAEAKFDPYHAWLGIPAWDRPANAYRLLGVEVFEQNRKVIEAAANRQMAYLQELSSGDEHIEEAQKMLGQVSKARVVLLNPEKKAAYDKKLIAQLDSLPEATGDGSQSTKIPTHSSAAVTLAKKEKGLNRLSVIRVTLLGLAGLLVIVCVLLFRSKNLVVRTYTDKNRNQRFDEGEEAANVGVVKFFIDPKKLGGGELDQFSWPTNDSGIVKLENIKAGPIGFTTEPPYEVIQPPDPDDPDKVSADDEKLFYEALVENGPRFFAQVVDIPVIQIENAAQSPAEEKQPSQAVQGEVVDNKQQQREPEKSFGSKTSEFELSGQITTANPESEPQVLNRPWFIDTDGNGVWKRGKERSIVPDDQGRFEVVVSIGAIRDDTKFRVIPQGFDDQIQDPGGISLSLEDIKEGVLEIAVELERKSISYQGNVQMEPAEESPEGFVVYVDKNQNAQRDEGETHIKTNAEGNFQIEEEWFEDYQKPTILRVEAPEKYEIPVLTGRRKQNIKLPSITFKDANFKIVKKKNVINDPTDESQAEEEIVSIPDFKEDPEQYLTYLGYLPLLDDNKTWRLYDPDAATGFTKAKAAYVKARKQKKWDAQLQNLSAVINARQAEADQYGADAGKKSKKGPTAKKEAKTKRVAILKQIDKWNEEQKKIQAEKERSLDNIRSNLATLTSNSQNYQRAEADENCEKAAQAAGIELMPVPDKHRKTWETANRFDAELALEEQFGLTAIGKGKNKTWSLQSLATIKSKEQQFNQIYTQFRASGYLQLKQQQDKLTAALQFETPEAQQVKSKLQQMERNPKFKQGITQLKTKAKSFFDALNQAILQIARVREKKEQIKTYFERTGGNYKKFIETLPDDKSLDAQFEKVQTVLALLPA